MAAVGSLYSGRFSAACRTGRYTGVGWSPGGVCWKDCRTGSRTCRCVAGQGVIRASDGRRVAFVGRIAGQAAGHADVLPGRMLYGRWMVAGWRLWEGLPDRQPDMPMCCRAGRYTGAGWSPGGVCGKDCRTCRCVAGQGVIRVSDGRRNGLSEEWSAFTGSPARQAVWMIAGRVPGAYRAWLPVVIPGFSGCPAAAGQQRERPGRRSPSVPFPGPVTRLFLRPPATGFLPRPVCGSDRGKSSRV